MQNVQVDQGLNVSSVVSSNVQAKDRLKNLKSLSLAAQESISEALTTISLKGKVRLYILRVDDLGRCYHEELDKLPKEKLVLAMKMKDRSMLSIQTAEVGNSKRIFSLDNIYVGINYAKNFIGLVDVVDDMVSLSFFNNYVSSEKRISTLICFDENDIAYLELKPDQGMSNING